MLRFINGTSWVTIQFACGISVPHPGAINKDIKRIYMDLLYSDVFRSFSIVHWGFKVCCLCLCLMTVVVWWIYWIQDLLGFAWHWNKHLRDLSSLTYFGILFWRACKYCHCCYTLYLSLLSNLLELVFWSMMTSIISPHLPSLSKDFPKHEPWCISS